jgi:hypothetical protein
VSIEPVANFDDLAGSSSANAKVRRSWAGMGLVVGWLLLVLATYQLATLDSVAQRDPAPPNVRRTPIASIRDPEVDSTAQHRSESMPSSEELLNLATGGIRAMEDFVDASRDSQRFNDVTSLATVESLLDVASSSSVSDWRKRAACYALAGLLLKTFHSSTPAELERAGDAMLIAGALYRQNGSAEDANAASGHAVGAYEAILSDNGVSDAGMRRAVERKLARAKAMDPAQAESVR